MNEDNNDKTKVPDEFTFVLFACLFYSNNLWTCKLITNTTVTYVHANQQLRLRFYVLVCYLQSLILYFPVAHNSLCLPPRVCINYCCEMQTSQEHFTTIVYAKFGEQTVIYGQLQNREYSPMKIILKEVLASGSVNFGQYSPMFTSPSWMISCTRSSSIRHRLAHYL